MMMKRVALAFLFLVASAVQGANAASLSACLQEKVASYRSQSVSVTPHERALMAMFECESALNALVNERFFNAFPRPVHPSANTKRIENIQILSSKNDIRNYYLGFVIQNIAKGYWN
jgi:hypothetical protein